MLKFFINLIRGVNTNFFNIEWWWYSSLENIMSAISKAKRKDLLATDECKKTALMYATWAITDPAIIKHLIELGSNVNAKDKYGRTVLMHAAIHNNPTIIRTLIEQEAGINTKDKDGWTALMHAAEWDNSELTQTLIEYGADVNAKANNGMTALMIAAEGENSKTIQTLIKHGANVNEKANNGKTALMIAARQGNSAIIQTLIKRGADVNAKAKDNWTALMYAVHAVIFNKLNNIPILIEHGADINSRDKNDWTALKHAQFWRCSSEIIKMLNGHQTNVKAENNNGKTLLLHAKKQMDQSRITKSDTNNKVRSTSTRTNSNYQKPEISRKNIQPAEKNTDKINLTDKSVSLQNRKMTKSHYQEDYDNLIAAIQSNDIKKVKRYARSEYINIHNNEHYSFTPIMYAITKKDIDPKIISILLSEGANVYENYKTGAATHTALELAILQNNEVAIDEICDFLDIPDENREKLLSKLNISDKNQYQDKHNIGYGNHDFHTMGTWYKGNEVNNDDIDNYS